LSVSAIGAAAVVFELTLSGCDLSTDDQPCRCNWLNPSFVFVEAMFPDAAALRSQV
jgi:hypothetical protein